MTCERGIDAGAYVLHALDEDELHAYAQHVQGCADCRREVEQLQMVVDTLPMAVPQELPPPVLKDRIMRTVLAEAELLQAAGPEADRVPAAAPPRRRRLSFGGFSLRPAVAAGLAAAFVAVGVAGGSLIAGGDDGPPATTRVIAGSSPLRGTKVSLAMSDGKGELRVRNLPGAKEGRVYQVWLVKGESDPVATHTLFNVRDDGRADVKISEPMDGVDRVLVTSEPDGGSTTPSGAPLLLADTSA